VFIVRTEPQALKNEKIKSTTNVNTDEHSPSERIMKPRDIESIVVRKGGKFSTAFSLRKHETLEQEASIKGTFKRTRSQRQQRILKSHSKVVSFSTILK